MRVITVHRESWEALLSLFALIDTVFEYSGPYLKRDNESWELACRRLQASEGRIYGEYKKTKRVLEEAAKGRRG